MFKDYFRLALRSVKQRKLRSILTMLGIFIGIAAVVSLISLSEGLQNAISEQFVNLGTDKIVIQAAGSSFGPPGTAVSTPLSLDDKKALEKVKGVDLVVGRLIRIIKMEFKDEVKYNFAVSMPKDNEEQKLVKEANNYEIDEGKFFERDNSQEIVIGSNFAIDFFDEPLELRDKLLVQGKQFKIVGILKKSGNPQQDSTIILPEGSFREVLGINSEFDVIPLRVEAGEDVNIVGERVKKALRKSRNVEEGKEDFSVQTPQQVLGILNNILSIIQGVLVGIAGISLFVGGIGIMNTMYTAVLERTKEIGIMKSVGARNSTVMLIFLIESGFLGLFGGLMGIILGFGFSKLVEVIAFNIFGSFLIKASVNYYLLFGALLFSFLVGSFSGVFPARQAARLKPVEAFRK
jgi:putative ABC transport system permease protein